MSTSLTGKTPNLLPSQPQILIQLPTIVVNAATWSFQVKTATYSEPKPLLFKGLYYNEVER